MKAIYRGKEKEIWIINREVTQPDWVEYGFKADIIAWTSPAEKELRVNFTVLMTSNIVKEMIKKSRAKRNFFLSIFAGGYAGSYETMFGGVGDVINLTEGIIVSAKKFSKSYEIVEP